MDNKYLLIPIANPTIGATLVPCHVSLIPWVSWHWKRSEAFTFWESMPSDSALYVVVVVVPQTQCL